MMMMMMIMILCRAPISTVQQHEHMYSGLFCSSHWFLFTSKFIIEPNHADIHVECQFIIEPKHADIQVECQFIIEPNHADIQVECLIYQNCTYVYLI